jgi:hypothetical protein
MWVGRRGKCGAVAKAKEPGGEDRRDLAESLVGS